MATNIRSAYLDGSGVLVDATTSVVIQDTRINIASGSDHVNINFADMGIRIDGLVSVAAPTSTSTITVMYG